MIWPFRKKPKGKPITVHFVALVDEVKDDTYTMVVCGAEERDGQPLKVYGARERGEHLSIGDAKYIKLEVNW